MAMDLGRYRNQGLQRLCYLTQKQAVTHKGLGIPRDAEKGLQSESGRAGGCRRQWRGNARVPQRVTANGENTWI